jgi:transcriptional regulator with XRE-family HTH domain
MRNVRTRSAHAGRDRCHALARRFGREVRLARVAAGLSQARIAAMAEVSQQVVSDTERGDPNISLEIRCRIAAACGHELGWKLYPVATVSLRDSGQLGIAQAIASAAHPSWSTQLERPVAAGDLRAADLLMGIRDELVHVEIERSLVDAQAQIRSAQVKREIIAAREPRPTRLIIAVPDSRLVRNRLAPFERLFRATLPVPSREIWRAIRRGHPVGGDGFLFVRADRAVRSASGPLVTAGRGR